MSDRPTDKDWNWLANKLRELAAGSNVEIIGLDDDEPVCGHTKYEGCPPCPCESRRILKFEVAIWPDGDDYPPTVVQAVNYILKETLTNMANDGIIRWYDLAYRP